MLCYFVTFLAQEGISPATIKTYLAAVRHAQVVRGFPEPRESSTLPRLRLIQNGVKRQRSLAGQATQERLPITPAVLRRMQRVLHPPHPPYEDELIWAASAVCFFGFFRAGEIAVASLTSYDPASCLSWGDVAISEDSQVVRVFLKRSKTDQFGRGTEVFLGATGDEICPVTAVSAYVARRGAVGWSLLLSQGWPTSDEGEIRGRSQVGASTSRGQSDWLLWAQFPDRGGDCCSSSGAARFHDSSSRQVV